MCIVASLEEGHAQHPVAYLILVHSSSRLWYNSDGVIAHTENPNLVTSEMILSCKAVQVGLCCGLFSLMQAGLKQQGLFQIVLLSTRYAGWWAVRSA